MRTRKQSNPTYQPVIIGIILSVVTTILLSALGAVFIDNESIQLAASEYISFIVWLISGFICSLFAGHTGEGSWLLRSGIAAVIYYLILLSVGILIFDGINGNTLYGLLADALGFLSAIFLISRKQKRPVNRKIRNFKIR